MQASLPAPLAPADFLAELDRRIAPYDLLRHPFYQAWEAGELSRADLAAYAAEYFPQVSAFPTYLSRLHARMEDGPRRRAVLRNLAGEELQGRAHSELWLDFAEAMGCERDAARRAERLPEMAELVAAFQGLAENGSPMEAIAAFYSYESQVPRVAETKSRGLSRHYGADARGTAYFTLHATADVEHSRAWARELQTLAAEDATQVAPALAAAEATARALWRALDGVERERRARRSAA